MLGRLDNAMVPRLYPNSDNPCASERTRKSSSSEVHDTSCWGDCRASAAPALELAAEIRVEAAERAEELVQIRRSIMGASTSDEYHPLGVVEDIICQDDATAPHAGAGAGAAMISICDTFFRWDAGHQMLYD